MKRKEIIIFIIGLLLILLGIIIMNINNEKNDNNNIIEKTNIYICSIEHELDSELVEIKEVTYEVNSKNIILSEKDNIILKFKNEEYYLQEKKMYQKLSQDPVEFNDEKLEIYNYIGEIEIIENLNYEIEKQALIENGYECYQEN